MEIDLNLLKCFEAVADNNSISLASKTLHLSQPAISLQIKKLEGQISRKLFDRHNRGLILTNFGSQFLIKTKLLLEVQTELKMLVNQTEQEATGKLRVGTYTTASSYLVSGPAAQFLTENPKVSLVYNYDESRQILEKVKSLQIECAVLTDVPADPNLKIEKFFEDELVFAIANQKKALWPKQIQPRDLSSFRFLSYPLRHDLCYRTVESKFGAHLNKCEISTETESFDTLKQMLLKGAGATFIPRYLIAKEIEAGVISTIQIGQTRLPITFSFVTKKNSLLSLSTQKFKDSIFKFYRS